MHRSVKSLLIFTALLTVMITTACSTSQSSMYDLAPVGDLPSDIQASPRVVTKAYQFAVANPDVLTQLPCYCGCGGMGHTSNYACYVTEENPDGSLVFDNHALGCSICVDITTDAMRMLDDGKSTTEIRTYVDQTYSAFGPSNMP